MKVVFICSSLEPAKDGVGDYTRKLACALNNAGHTTSILAINDRRLENNTEHRGVQQDEETEIPVLRLSSVLSWDERIKRAKVFVNEFNPDWLSLQYVPFGFHLKGLPFNIGNKLARIPNGQPWQVMFHELSVNRDESLKFKIWSALQVQIIQSLLNKLKPMVIKTNTELYKYRLKEMGFEASVLPLFSNISRIENFDEAGLNNLIPAFIQQYRDDYIIGTLFGAFDFRRWNMRSLLDKFNYSFNKKRVVIVSIGRMSAGTDCWEKLKYEYPQVVFLSLGEQSAGFISHWLTHYTNFGILTTLPELAGKSGSFMAFKEHGVPVVCREETEILKSLYLPVEKGLIEVNEEKNFVLPAKQQPVNQLNIVVQNFIDSLNEAKTNKNSSIVALNA